MEGSGQERMLTLRQAADILSVSLPTLYRHLASRGMSTFHRIGDRRSYLRLRDVETLRDFRPRGNDQPPS